MYLVLNNQHNNTVSQNTKQQYLYMKLQFRRIRIRPSDDVGFNARLCHGPGPGPGPDTRDYPEPSDAWCGALAWDGRTVEG